MSTDFTGKHIVVTGGGSGVGAEIAAQFSAAGGAVSILGRRREALERVAARIGATPISCDVTERRVVQQALETARARNGPIHVAVANAGAAVSKPFARIDAADWQGALDVNLTGVFNIWQACMGEMQGAGAGRLIAVASTAGLKGYPYVTGYCAAKHGVVGLTRALALELGRSGVTVNAVAPGFVETPLLERSIQRIGQKTGQPHDQVAKRLMAGNPQARFIQVGEVASAVLWLASEAAGAVNGHVLPISGGEI
jgi:NAD(P)-dependent dehydrogenase (short-subunit alcohol dehydrogenase family)